MKEKFQASSNPMPKPKPTLWISFIIWAHWEHTFKSIIVNLENKLLTFTIVQTLFIYLCLFIIKTFVETTTSFRVIWNFESSLQYYQC
jgi:hypothetical protein